VLNPGINRPRRYRGPEKGRRGEAVKGKSQTMITLFLILASLFSTRGLGVSVVKESAKAFAQETNLQKADRLYADRDKVESLKQAILLVEKELTNYEAMWRLAKFKYYLSDTQTDEKQKIKLLQEGITAAEKAIKLDTTRAEGHFWMGATKGAYAELKGAFSAMGLVKSVRREFETALKIDPAYSKGTTHLALGELLLRLPALMGGSDKKGIQYLEEGLKYGPQNAELKLLLAEQYSKKDKKTEAKRLLEEIMKEEDPLRTPNEQADLRNKAQQLFAKMK
jgi:tetratricopeptide (TPR) repeat protein